MEPLDETTYAFPPKKELKKAFDKSRYLRYNRIARDAL
jgi:hypothetical protein